MNFLVYVAAPFEDAALVRSIHDRLESIDMSPTSRWALSATSAEDFAKFTPSQLRGLAQQNDSDLRGSDVALVVARAGAGGEMFAEARMALEWGKPVVWVGRWILSAWRRGVVRAGDIDGAFETLIQMRAKYSEGYRGHMLAHLSGCAA